MYISNLQGTDEVQFEAEQVDLRPTTVTTPDTGLIRIYNDSGVPKYRTDDGNDHAFGGGTYPVTATLWHDERKAVTGSGMTIEPLQYFNIPTDEYASRSHQDDVTGQAWEIKFFLAAGTYDFRVLYAKNVDCGITEFFVDGVSIGTIDHYDAGDTPNQRTVISSVAVVGDGVHTLRGEVDTKNGSSSGYYAPLTKMDFSQ